MDVAGWAERPALTTHRCARRSPWPLVAGVVIGVALLEVWIDGARQWFIPCAADCGETFDAIQYAAKYRSYGFRYGLVQDMSTSAALERFPFFYSHNVNVHRVWIVLAEGHRSAGLFAQVAVDSDANEPRPRMPWPQPKVNEIIEQDPGQPVKEVECAYVLFGLRLLRSRVGPASQPTVGGRPT